MKTFISLILALLLLLPNCGMVFAGSMEDMPHDTYVGMTDTMMTTESEIIESPLYDCCSDESHENAIVRDVRFTSTVHEILSTPQMLEIPRISLTESHEEKNIPCILYREGAPPDRDEYTALIGNSVKNLN